MERYCFATLFQPLVMILIIIGMMTIRAHLSRWEIIALPPIPTPGSEQLSRCSRLLALTGGPSRPGIGNAQPFRANAHKLQQLRLFQRTPVCAKHWETHGAF